MSMATHVKSTDQGFEPILTRQNAEASTTRLSVQLHLVEYRKFYIVMSYVLKDGMCDD